MAHTEGALSATKHFIVCLFCLFSAVVLPVIACGPKPRPKIIWSDYSSEQGGFTVRFPGRPDSHGNTGVFTWLGTSRDGSVFLVLYTANKSANPLIVQSALFESILDHPTISVHLLDGLTNPQAPCSQFEGRDSRIVLQGRICISARGTVLAMTTRSVASRPGESASFLSSLTVTQPPPHEAALSADNQVLSRALLAAAQTCDYGRVDECKKRADNVDMACKADCLAASAGLGAASGFLCAAMCWTTKKVLYSDCERTGCGAFVACQPPGLCSSGCGYCQVCGFAFGLYPSCKPKCPDGLVCHNDTCICPAGGTFCPQMAGLPGGICANLLNDPQHCGDCTTHCALGASCTDGHCKCSSGKSECYLECVDITSDRRYCGLCSLSAACTNGKECSNGQCVCPAHVCSDGQSLDPETCKCPCAVVQTRCNSQCVDTSTDAKNCGHCDNACTKGLVCDKGLCVCPAGQVLSCWAPLDGPGTPQLPKCCPIGQYCLQHTGEPWKCGTLPP